MRMLIDENREKREQRIFFEIQKRLSIFFLFFEIYLLLICAFFSFLSVPAVLGGVFVVPYMHIYYLVLDTVDSTRR